MYRNVGSKLRRGAKDLLSLLLLVVVILAARSSIADHYVVPTGSMEPTVLVGDRLVVDKLAYGLRVPFTQLYLTEADSPRPGDVVVLRSPEDGTVLLKRLIAGPGDWVAVRRGRVILNHRPARVSKESGSVLESLPGKAHPVRLTHGGGPDFGPIRVPTKRYLVMGDNRGVSRDGRTFGLVDREALLGRAIGVYFSNRSLTWRSL